MPDLQLLCEFSTVEAFLHAFQTELKAGGLLVRGAQVTPTTGLTDCSVEVRVAREVPLKVSARLAAVIPGVGAAVTFPADTPSELTALAERLQRGPPPGLEPAEELPAAAPLSMRLKEMTVTEKMQLALSGDRDARAHLLRDHNKALHLYVLKNPRVGLDEVSYAARLATLSAEALKYIAEHRDWGANPAICAALARHPQIPVPLALRVLPKVPPQELRALAKGGARQPIVQAARKLVSG